MRVRIKYLQPNCNSARPDTPGRLGTALELLAKRLVDWQRGAAQQQGLLATACAPERNSLTAEQSEFAYKVELVVFVRMVAGCEPPVLVRRQPGSSARARSSRARLGRIGERRRIQHCLERTALLDCSSSQVDTGPAGRLLGALSGVRSFALIDLRRPAG